MSRFNGSRYDAQQTADAFVQRLRVDLDEVSRGLVGAERFSRRLRDTAEIGDVSADLLRLIDRTVQPASITIWMRGQP